MSKKIFNFVITKSDLGVGGVIKYSNNLYKNVFNKFDDIDEINEFYFYDEKLMGLKTKDENAFQNIKRTRLDSPIFKAESNNGRKFASTLTHWNLVFQKMSEIKKSIIVINITYTNLVSLFKSDDMEVPYEKILNSFKENEVIIIDHGVGNNKYDITKTGNSNVETWSELFSNAMLISYTENECDILEKYYFKFKKSYAIPLCSDLEIKMEKIDFEDKEFDFVFMGRFHNVKNIPKIIEFSEKNDFKTVFIGEGGEEFEKMIEASKNCFNAGVKTGQTKFEILNKSKFSINFSHAEGFSFSLIEGMQLGLPPIISSKKFLASHFIVEGGVGISTIDEESLLAFVNENNKKIHYDNLREKVLCEFDKKFKMEYFNKKWEDVIKEANIMLDKEKKIVHIYGWFSSNIGDDLLFDAFINNTNYDEYVFINAKSVYGASLPSQQSFLTIKYLYSKTGKNIKFSELGPEENLDKLIAEDSINSRIEYHFANVGGSLWGEKLIKQKYERSIKNKLAYKKTFAIGSNFSEFKKSESLKYLSKIIDNYTKFVVRDSWSKSLFPNKENVYLEADPVYWFYDEKKVNESAKEDRLVISLTRPEASFNQPFNKKEYFDSIWTEVKRLLDEEKINEIYFMSFNNNRDIPLSFDFAKEYNLLGLSKILHYEGDIEKFMDIYSKSKYSIATRFHSIIISNLFQLNTWAWSYDNKNINHLKDIGFSPKEWYKISKSKLKELRASSVKMLEHYEN